MLWGSHLAVRRPPYCDGTTRYVAVSLDGQNLDWMRQYAARPGARSGPMASAAYAFSVAATAPNDDLAPGQVWRNDEGAELTIVDVLPDSLVGDIWEARSGGMFARTWLVTVLSLRECGYSFVG